MLAAASVLVAVLASGTTWLTLRPPPRTDVAEMIVADHLRALMTPQPTDVSSTDRHTVKPWFNGRVDLSQAVPNLDSAGFPLAGGRVDYIDGRAVPVVTYMRRQHVLNVYARPTDARSSSATVSRNGFHIIEWQSGG